MAKKLSAMQSAPMRNMGLESTARMAPGMPLWARMMSRSPRLRMAAAMRHSPAMARAATVAMAGTR